MLDSSPRVTRVGLVEEGSAAGAAIDSVISRAVARKASVEVRIIEDVW